MKIVKKLELIRVIIGSIVVLITLCWAILNYVGLNKPKPRSEETHLICISNNMADCPSDTLYLACKSPIASVLGDDCLTYHIDVVSRKLASFCATSIVEVACL